MVAVVNTPGVLQFAWSRRAARDASGELAFDLRLPLASVNQLRLSLRRDLRPVADAAVVSALEENVGDSAEQTWLIEVRGDAELKLRLVPASEPPLAQPLTLLRQDQRYSVAPDAAEITVRLRLDVHQQPLSELTLQMDDALQLYRAYYRDTPLEWSESVSGTQRRVTLALPEPILGDGHEIRLQAIAAVDLGDRLASASRVGSGRLLAGGRQPAGRIRAVADRPLGDDRRPPGAGGSAAGSAARRIRRDPGLSAAVANRRPAATSRRRSGCANGHDRETGNDRDNGGGTTLNSPAPDPRSTRPS